MKLLLVFSKKNLKKLEEKVKTFLILATFRKIHKISKKINN